MNRYTAILLLIFTLGCASSSKENKSINIGTLKGPSSVGLIKLIEDNSYKTRIFNSPIHIRPELLQKKLSFAVIPASMAALLYNRGFEYRIAAVTGWGNLYIVGKKKISSFAELRGKSLYMVGKGVTPEAIVRYLMKESRISKNEIELLWTFPNPADLGTAAAAGLTDFALLPEPFASMAVAKNSNLKISFNITSTLSTKVPQTVLVARKDIADDPSRLRHIITACSTSSEWVNQNYKEAATIVKKHKIIPVISEASIRRCNIRFVSAAKAEKELFVFFALLHSFNPLLTGGKIPDEAILIR